jgi:DNA-binding GntR family transcriptional regulator
MPKTRDKDLVREVYQVLLKKIITLEIKPGETIREASLLEELKVSRTPLRMALTMLRQDNLIEGEPNKSSFVKGLSIDEFRSLIESLIIIEKNAACLAAERITPGDFKKIEESCAAVDRAIEDKDLWGLTSNNFTFHGLISRAGGNDFLFRFQQTLRHQAERFSFLAISREINGDAPPIREHHRKISLQHRELIEALRQGDADLVEEISIRHIVLFQERIFRLFKEVSYR